MTTETAPLDRRHRRRLETIEEVLDHAIAIMAEEGVAGLSLGEIARRMGIRTPSLYVYFPSKHALYDALFARGWRELLAAMQPVYSAVDDDQAGDLAEIMLRSGRVMSRWAVENAAYAQLLFWRPVPGFRPSDEAYAPAIELYEQSLSRLAQLQERGLIRRNIDVDDVQRDWTIVISGVVSQQLANAPDQSFDSGRFITALPGLVDMFVAHYGVPARTQTAAHTTSRRRGHADRR
ncbi:MAG TPA: TetR/AcrR family transcriptional regulator [Mycobacteriales bacterium]|jgi:AcrR family transcriptional regulator|nr:TetR/AcrR family transcriptional regulator [Mycobacteriales bacterium]